MQVNAQESSSVQSSLLFQRDERGNKAIALNLFCIVLVAGGSLFQYLGISRALFRNRV